MLIRNALVLPGGGDWQARRADILIRGERIAGLGHGFDDKEIIEGDSLLAVPGFVNAHYHSPLSILPGTADGFSHPAFMWQNQVDTARRTSHEVYVSALLGGIEMLTSGTTAVMDHFPEQGFPLEHVDAVVRAYRALGMRAVIALRVFDEAYDDIVPSGGLPEGFPNPLVAAPLAETMSLLEEAIAAYDDAEGLVRVFPAPSNPGRCSDALLVQCEDLARRRGLGVHTHLLETEIQTRIAQQRYGTTMVQHMERLGLLSPRLSCAHTIWIEEDDIARLARHGVTVVHNPESNLKVGAGFMPLPAMRRHGVRVALGTDGASTNDNLVLHEAMRLAITLHRPREERSSWARAGDALDMVTTAGATALQSDRIGRIEAGQSADLVLYDLSKPRWTPCNDPAQQLVFAETGDCVHTVLVAGRTVVRNGKLIGIDIDSLLREARDMLTSIRKRNSALQTAVNALWRNPR
ncbi:MAG TPA: amidohydrolase [Burkholderiales bacterium]|nr:amidohydrolase [Burkholderiales bacterium]